MLHKNRAKTNRLFACCSNEWLKRSAEKAFECKSTGKHYRVLNYYFKLRFTLTVLLLWFLDSILEANRHAPVDTVLNISSALCHRSSYRQEKLLGPVCAQGPVPHRLLEASGFLLGAGAFTPSFSGSVSLPFCASAVGSNTG